MAEDDVIEQLARELCIADGFDPDDDGTRSDGFQLGVALPPNERQQWRTYIHKAKAMQADGFPGYAEAMMRMAGLWPDKTSG